MKTYNNIFDNNNISATSVCYVVGGRGIETFGFLPKEGDFIIAADKGYRYLKDAGYTPHLVVGDFDSLGEIPNHDNIIKLPEQKEDTDTFFALKQGLNKGYDTFIIHGGMGGRPDHTQANIQSMAFLAQEGKIGYLLGEGMAVTAIKNSSFTFRGKNKGLISIFSHSDTSFGVSAFGFLYPMSDLSLSNTFPLGVSNEFRADFCGIKVTDGTLIIMWEI